MVPPASLLIWGKGEREELNTMEYFNFRVDRQWIINGKVVSGWFVLGQMKNNYNWKLLYEAVSFEAAKEFIRRIRDNDNQNVYGPDSYAIKM